MSPFGSWSFGSVPFGSGPFGPQPGAPAGLTLRVGPVEDAIKYLAYGSWRIHEILNGRNDATCTLLIADGFSPIVGQDLVLDLITATGSTRLFAGSIFSRKAEFYSEGRNDWVAVEVECADWNRIADKRKIAEAYENQTLGQIVRDVWFQTLSHEGILLGDIQDGPLISKVVFPNLLVSDALNHLSEATGYYWTIDYYKRLHVFQRQTNLAPFPIVNGVNAIFRGFSEDRTLAQYRNSQFIDGGKGLTVPRSEPFKGDGTIRSWDTEYPLASVPTILINGVPVPPQDVGIRGVEDNKRFYWAKGETSIGHAQRINEVTVPALTANDTITIQYIGLFDIATEIIDFAKVAERQQIEGGTGLYENVYVEDSLDGADVVVEKGLGLLHRYGLSSDVEFETDVSGLAIGQQLPITISELGITGQLYLITELESEHLVDHERRYRVRASTGELKGTSQEFWKRLFASKPITIREDAVVQTVTPFFESLAMDEAVSVELNDWAEAFVGFAIAGEDECPNP